LVLIHEFGHFAMARILGIKVEEFAFGLPFTPPIFKFQKGETQYAVYPLLFGGFVRLFGEEKREKGRKSFWDKRKRERATVIIAGVFMNVVLALTLFVFTYLSLGIPIGVVGKPTLIKIEEGSPAQRAGFQEGDRIIEVEGRALIKEEEFGSLMKSWAGLPVNITVESGSIVPLFEGAVEKNLTRKTITVVPRVNPPQGQGALGVGISTWPYVQTVQCQKLGIKCPFMAIGAGTRTTGVWMGRILDGLRQIGQSLSRGKSPEGVAGPVGIYQLTGMVADQGIWPLIELVAILSVNLAVFNVLPIPALDGGRLLFIGLEAILRKRISLVWEQRINSWGMAFLLGLMVLISLQDVIRLYLQS